MQNFIKSFNNKNIKNLNKIIKDSKYRSENKLFAIEGLKTCNEALENNVKIISTFYTDEFSDKNKNFIQKIINKTLDNSYIVSKNIIQRISDTKSSQGIICICKYIDNFVALNKIKNYNKILILDNIQDPSNLGAIIRTGNAMNADIIIISKNSCDIYNPKVIRCSAGSIFKIKFIFVDDIVNLINFLNQNLFDTCATVVDSGSEYLNKTVLKDKVAIVMGNEGSGISKDIIDICSKKIKIPINKNVESLNVSVATGIILWELFIRR